ncbi:hypothetical protein EHE19_015420 [Ruminiclostridium herbifermentans]|uniref:Prenylated flavin chaperone LpdD-like domain-containing protein n=1 Tax=Ruminiclostridium herbifermentans TaxID=2488810 RepID=A0A4U7JJN9_9FIRM|nr:hypothetical protein [Ruminiclostridium herbifermentans]QNU66256.1 hypothetical protein EHE19_015420 [Ruminiclostridium herbifermentans]
MIQITRKRNRLEIKMMAVSMGNDLCIILTGGDSPHLGAVTVGSCTEAFRTFTFKKHKENVITDLFSSILKRKYKGNFAICCGIHLDNISSEEINYSFELCQEIAEELCIMLRSKNI